MGENANVCGGLRSMTKKTTIKDIADKLEVSPSSVSRALTNEPGVSDDLRKRVFDAASRLNYIPNSSAKSLKTSRSKTVGLIVSDIRNPFFLDFMSGVERVLFPREYKFIVCNTGEDRKKEEIYIKWLIGQGVEGILSSPYQDGSNENNALLYRRAMKNNIPVVFYDRLLKEIKVIDSVTLDNRQAIMNGVMYLRECGHERIGICLHRRGIYTIEERYAGFLKACEILRIEVIEDWIIDDATDPVEASKRLKMILGRAHRPTALISTNQYINELLLRVARELKLSVPGELSLMGFDDLSLNDLVDPPITTIRQPVSDMGKIAATLLMGRIDGDSVDRSTVVLKAELLKRASVSVLSGP